MVGSSQENKSMLTIHGVDFAGLGSIDVASHYTCKAVKGEYYCFPDDKATLETVKNMQLAIDRFANIVDLYKLADKPTGQNPISSSAAGIDGIVGPKTADFATWMPTVAAALYRDAGEGDPGAAIIVQIRTISEEAMAQDAAQFAPEITEYLNATSDRFEELKKKIFDRQMAAFKEVVSLFVNPPPMPTEAELPKVTTPPNIKKYAKSKFSLGRLALGGGAALAAAGLCFAGAMAAKGEEEPSDLKVDVRKSAGKKLGVKKPGGKGGARGGGGGYPGGFPGGGWM